jgi:putative nucleotidyltransferase with HDIG domain
MNAVRLSALPNLISHTVTAPELYNDTALMTTYTGPSTSVRRSSRIVRQQLQSRAMTREQALSTLYEFTKSESLRKHALAVEACTVAYARKFGEDEQKWSVTALLHDFDYEMHPDAPDHPMKGEPILAERGVDPEVRRAILSHANYSGVPRESLLEKTLFACDELAGFLTAISYVKPGKRIAEVDVKSVRKKMKDKGFARSVSRDDIESGARELGVDLDEHIAFCIRAMQERADELGLAGTTEVEIR